MGEDSLQSSHKLYRYRRDGFDGAPAVTIWAFLIALAFDALAHPLPRHLNKADARYIQYVRFRLIVLDGPFQRPEYALSMLRKFHIDEVYYDDAAYIAKLKLPRHLLGSLHVRLEH